MLRRYSFFLLPILLLILLAFIPLKRLERVFSTSPAKGVPDNLPLILDFGPVMHGWCMRNALDRKQPGSLATAPASGSIRTSDFHPLPFSSWNKLFCSTGQHSCSCVQSESTCQPVPHASVLAACPITSLEKPAPQRISCGKNDCAVTSSLRAHGPAADAVMLYHIFLSDPVFRAAEAHGWLLFPPERTPEQLWAIVAMLESSLYYSAGRDPLFLSAFNLTIGSDRQHLDAFIVSYKPDWNKMLRRYSLPDKLSRPAVLRLSNITLVQSNCNSVSGREAFLRELMQLLPIDSFGSCLNSRDPGLFNNSNFYGGMETKHDLIYGYKFMLVFENSYMFDYVSEKIFDAWESHVVPVYRGASNIDDYAPGPHSFIHVDGAMTPEALASMLSALDKNDTAFEEYHAWRHATKEAITQNSPLARTLAAQDAGETPVCTVCNALHKKRKATRP